MNMANKTAIVKIRYPDYEKKINKSRQQKGENVICEHIKYCFSVSSLHGLNHIVWPRRSIFERLFWICAVFGLGIFGVLKGYEIVMHYYNRPCVISVEMDNHNWNNEFPSFTMCQIELDENALMRRNISVDSDMYEFLLDLAFGNYSSYYLYEKYANGSKKELLQPKDYLDLLLDVVPTIQNNSNSEDNIIFPFNDERPIPKIATEHGICSTLNPSNGIYYTPQYFNSSDPYNHDPITFDYRFTLLKFEVRHFSHPYKVALHSPHEVIDIGAKMYSFKTVTVATFTTSVLAVWTPAHIESLSFHQRHCKLYTEAEELHHSPVYTYNLCKIECRIQLCLKYCKCTPYYYRRLPGERICNMTGMYCLSKYEYQLINLYDNKENKSLCDCHQTCGGDIILLDEVTSMTWFKDTRMDIQILEPPRLRYVRRLVFSKLDLLVQIGGILGLCLGCTILGIIEVVYFMTLRFYWGVVKGKSIKSSL